MPAFCCPASQAGLDLGAAGFELRLLLEGEANEIDQVGGDLRPAAANVGRVDTLVGAPELVRCQMRTSVNRLFNQRGERLDLLEREANGVGLAIENLQYLDLVFVVAEELFKRLHHAQGAFAHYFRWAGFQEMVLVDGINDLLVTLLYTKDIEKTREACGRSLEEAARLSGMETSEWAAIEAGCVPDPAQLHPISDALGLRYDKIAMLAFICQGAWEV